MKHGSLFSGVGGFDLAASWMGWENVFHVEINKACQERLESRFDNTKIYEDVTTFDGSIYEGKIDIITGSFPCQPFSNAGQRKGIDDERYLWPAMYRIIKQIRPTFVVVENVYGVLNWAEGMVVKQVCVDLEAEGYEVQVVVLPACGVNAPHGRKRVWWNATHPERDRRSRRKAS
jgi:DNA (cytosine-5)-methyltransferase 1